MAVCHCLQTIKKKNSNIRIKKQFYLFTNEIIKSTHWKSPQLKYIRLVIQTVSSFCWISDQNQKLGKSHPGRWYSYRFDTFR